MTVQPISPDEVGLAKVVATPDEVFQAFNTLIALNYVGGYSTVKQDDVMELLEATSLVRADIFKNGWLNVEEAYRSVGWTVEYDKPAYNESYPATFTFRKKK